MSQFDHLSEAEVRALLERVVALLRPSDRRDLVGQVRPPPNDDVEAALAALADKAAELADAVTEGVADALWNDRVWGRDAEDSRADWGALAAELTAARERAEAALDVAQPSPSLCDAVRGALAALEELRCAESPDGLTAEDCEDDLIWAPALEAWLVAWECGESGESMARRFLALGDDPPVPCAARRALGVRQPEVLSALDVLAAAGDAKAAKWCVALAADSDEQLDVLRKHARLAPVLGRLLAESLAAAGADEELEEAAAAGVAVPAHHRYDALLRLGRHAEAFEIALTGEYGGVRAHQAWDDAVSRGAVDALRAAAAGASSGAARWIAASEASLLEPPAAYDHDATKGLVRFAVARLTHGALVAPCSVWHGELIDRVALARPPEDPERCLQAALAGYEGMILFHIEARGRNRYRRAAAYWAAHEALTRRAGCPAASRILRQLCGEDVRRLPALRDELAAARVRV